MSGAGEAAGAFLTSSLALPTSFGRRGWLQMFLQLWGCLPHTHPAPGEDVQELLPLERIALFLCLGGILEIYSIYIYIPYISHIFFSFVTRAKYSQRVWVSPSFWWPKTEEFLEYEGLSITIHSTNFPHTLVTAGTNFLDANIILDSQRRGSKAGFAWPQPLALRVGFVCPRFSAVLSNCREQLAISN